MRLAAIPPVGDESSQGRMPSTAEVPSSQHSDEQCDCSPRAIIETEFGLRTVRAYWIIAESANAGETNNSDRLPTTIQHLLTGGIGSVASHIADQHLAGVPGSIELRQVIQEAMSAIVSLLGLSGPESLTWISTAAWSASDAVQEAPPKQDPAQGQDIIDGIGDDPFAAARRYSDSVKGVIDLASLAKSGVLTTDEFWFLSSFKAWLCLVFAPNAAAELTGTVGKSDDEVDQATADLREDIKEAIVHIFDSAILVWLFGEDKARKIIDEHEKGLSPAGTLDTSIDEAHNKIGCEIGRRVREKLPPPRLPRIFQPDFVIYDGFQAILEWAILLVVAGKFTQRPGDGYSGKNGRYRPWPPQPFGPFLPPETPPPEQPPPEPPPPRGKPLEPIPKKGQSKEDAQKELGDKLKSLKRLEEEF